MHTVGSVLREARLRQGLTIDAISIDTKISSMRLQALEADEMGAFSSPFFYRSFVKQVAQRLNIGEQSIAQALESQAASIRPPLLPGEDERHTPNVPALENVGELARFRWLIPVLSLVAVVVGSSVIFAWWEQASTTKHARVAVVATTSPASTAASSAPAAVKPQPPPAPAPAPQQPAKPEEAAAEPEPDSAPASAQAESPGTAPAAVAESPVQLELAAIEDVWISVVSDGKFIFSGILGPAQSKSFSSHQVARLQVGNAGGLNIKYNGRQIPPLGARGSVCTAIFTADKFEIVQPQPRIEATSYEPGEE